MLSCGVNGRVSSRMSGLLARLGSRNIADFSPSKGSLKNSLIQMYTPHLEESLPAGLPKELPKWQEALGERTISFFNLDMDRIRAGRISGNVYYEQCRNQAYYPLSKNDADKPLSLRASFWYDTMGIPKTYIQWFQITSLHVWMLFVKMRCFPNKYCREYQQKLVDKLFEKMDTVMKEDLNVPSSRAVNDYKKTLNDQLRGSVFAYDEALASGEDSALAGALWRNLFGAEFEADLDKLNYLVSYVRTQLYVLDLMSDVDFARGSFEFLDPTKTYSPLTEGDKNEIRAAIAKYRESAEKVAFEPSEKSVLSTEGL